MTETARRLSFHKVPKAQAETLEKALPAGVPGMWHEFALSFFITLLSFKDWREMREEKLAVELVGGLSQDLGGTQPYIPSWVKTMEQMRRRERVLELLAAGSSYAEAAADVGLTESRVRKIERDVRLHKRTARR